MGRPCALGARVCGPEVVLVEPRRELVELAGLSRNGFDLFRQPLLDMREPELGLGFEARCLLFAIGCVSQDLFGAIARTPQASGGIGPGSLRRFVSLQGSFRP